MASRLICEPVTVQEEWNMLIGLSNQGPLLEKEWDLFCINHNDKKGDMFLGEQVWNINLNSK